MAFGGGTFTKYDKFMPGTYINTITIGAPQSEAVRGVTTTGLVLDWGPDNTPFEIGATDFQENAESITGYAYNDPKNVALRELFRNANVVIGYKLNSKDSKKAKSDKVGEARYSGTVGNDITVSVYADANDEEKYDVSTYYKGVLKDLQIVPKDTLTNKTVTVEKSGSSIVGETSGASDLQTSVTATYTFEKNQVTVKFNSLPSKYELKPNLKYNTSNAELSPGVIDLEVDDNNNTATYTFGPDAQTAQDYTFEAIVKEKSSETKYTFNSHKFKVKVTSQEETGASAAALSDNDFVIFKKEGTITQNAGYSFEGGESGSSVVVGDYSNYLGALESRSFDVLVYDGTEESVKELFTTYTKRMRDEVGKYFQTVLYDYDKADYEGVISVYNKVSEDSEYIKESSLVNWVAGYSSAVDLSNELTSKLYNGELNVDTSTPDAKLEIIVKKGNFVFHRVSETEVYTLFDVNTLTTFTEDHDQRLSENKTIRVIDYIHNTEAYQINRNYIGSTPNTVEGRALIWNRCYEILDQLQQAGAITGFVENDLTVDPVPTDRHAVRINQSFAVTGTIYRVYITTYITQ